MVETARSPVVRETGRMNDWLLDLINGKLAGRSNLADGAAAWLAGDALFLLAAVAILLGILELRHSPKNGTRIGVIALLAGGCAGAFILVTAAAVSETRPFLADPDTVQLVAHSADNSFPSDHATFAAVIATVGSLAWRRWSPIFLGLAGLTGLARVFVGVHYPGDVAAGWFLGALAALIAWWGLPRLILLRSRIAELTTGSR